ncbi:hypothetical protein ACJX0J_019733, partial [Zea mays]
MDGVVTLHETIHEMHRKKKNGIILKLDFEKAYDKVFLLPGAPGYNKQGDPVYVGCISEKTNSLSIFMLSFFETDQMELINEDGVNKTITQAQYMPGDSQFWSGLMKVKDDFLRHGQKKKTQDTFFWSLQKHGRFTVRSMYKAFIAPHIIFMWYLIKNIKTLERDISSWIVLLLDAFGEGIQHMFGNWLNGVDDTL